MNYEIFKRCAALNSEFEIIPSNVKLLSVGIVLNDNGYMKYNGATYITNMVKLKELPEKIQSLFMELARLNQKYPTIDKSLKEIALSVIKIQNKVLKMETH